MVESRYTDSRRALEQKEYHLALLTSCGILEAIVTDALEHRGLSSLVESGAPAEKIGLVVSEHASPRRGEGGIDSQRVRPPAGHRPSLSRSYVGNDGIGVKTEVTERDARTAGQVLHVVMRDLDPGR